MGLDYKKIDDVKIFALNEINHNDLMSKKSHYLNNVEHLFFSVLTVTSCVSVPTFASLVCVSVGITSSAVGINICAIIAGIKKCNSIIKKKKHYERELLGKGILNNITVLISKALIDSCISHEEFFSAINVLREYNEIK